MLALRQFDTRIGSAEPVSRDQDQTASTVLQFAAQHTGSLPPFIASFTQPVHVDLSLPGAELDDGYEWQEMDAVAPETPSSMNPT